MVDLAVTGDELEGKVVVHAADCLQVRRLAAEGHPVVTMFDCEAIPDNYEQHECLKQKRG